MGEQKQQQSFVVEVGTSARPGAALVATLILFTSALALTGYTTNASAVRNDGPELIEELGEG